MKELELSASVRTETGTGASRRMRRNNRIPAVLYGEKKETIPLFVDANELNKRLEDESFGSRVLTLDVESRKETAVLKAIQRYPVNSRVLHVDFQRVSETRQIQLRIPLRFTNEDLSKAKRAGAVISHLLTDVEVICLPRNLPEALSVDVSDLQIGQTLHLSELTLPEGVELTALTHGTDHAVVTVSMPRGSATDDEISEEGETLSEDGSETESSDS